MDEEEDANMEKTRDDSSDEDEDPLPQPGDMYVEFKKSSLPNKGNKPKVQFVPSRFLQDNKVELCKRVLKLELENKKALCNEKKTTSSPPPPPKET